MARLVSLLQLTRQILDCGVVVVVVVVVDIYIADIDMVTDLYLNKSQCWRDKNYSPLWYFMILESV